MKLPLILPVPLLAPAFVSIFAPKIAPKAQPADLDRIGYDTIKNAPPEAGKEARQAYLAALFGGDLSAPAAPVAAAPVAAAPAAPAAAIEPAAPAEQATAEPAAPPTEQAQTEDLTDDEIKRYSRHLILEDVGVEGVCMCFCGAAVVKSRRETVPSSAAAAANAAASKRSPACFWAVSLSIRSGSALAPAPIVRLCRASARDNSCLLNRAVVHPKNSRPYDKCACFWPWRTSNDLYAPL